MHFLMLATDYDGTLANDGHVAPKTLAALDRLRASGRKLVLVTGRHIPDLSNVFSRFDLFDRIIAENGGLLYRPATREEKLLCDPTNQQFLALLRKRKIKFVPGRTVVASWLPQGKAISQAIRDLGLDLQITLNKDSIMVLPSGVDKATGLEAALRELEISAQNVVAVGDAENDHSFLRAAECGVAVANALPSLKEDADIVLDAPNGDGVIQLIDQIISGEVEIPARRFRQANAVVQPGCQGSSSEPDLK